MPAIKTITLAGGRKRYRFVIELPHGPGEKRHQETHTFERLSDAKAELARLTHQSGTGEYAGRWNGTVSELIDRYLKHAEDGAEANTKASYRHALAPVRERLGSLRARDVDREHVQELKDWMLTSGRRRGGKPGTALSARTVRLTMGQFSAAYELAIVDRKLNYNPVRYVKLPKQARADHGTWSKPQVQQFLAEAAADRLHAAWRLALYGLRRGEILGLRKDDYDRKARTIKIGRARVLVEYVVIEKSPKSLSGYRTLPVDDQLAAALEALLDRQVTEAMDAAGAYEDTGYIVTDELGRPVHPEWFSDEFHRVRARTGLPRIRLHDSRGTINSLMASAGVPRHIRAAWCGHTEAVNASVYTHARPEDLAAAMAVLDKIENEA
jgi:integrase